MRISFESDSQKLIVKPSRHFWLNWKLVVVLAITLANILVVTTLVNVTLVGKVVLVFATGGIALSGLVSDKFMDRVGRNLRNFDGSS